MIPESFSGKSGGSEDYLFELTERQALFDSSDVGRMNNNRLAKTALGFTVFPFRQMAFSSLGAHELAGTGDFEAFRGGFARFIAWSSLWHEKRDGKITEFQQVAMKTLEITRNASYFK